MARRRRAKIINVGGKRFQARITPRLRNRSFVVSGRKGFTNTVLTWGDLLLDNLAEIVEEVGGKAYNNIVERTPVLSGEAAAGWFVRRPSDLQYFIGNDEPHIRRLEHGWSRQEGKGFMVRSTEKKLRDYVNQAAERVAR